MDRNSQGMNIEQQLRFLALLIVWSLIALSFILALPCVLIQWGFQEYFYLGFLNAKRLRAAAIKNELIILRQNSSGLSINNFHIQLYLNFLAAVVRLFTCANPCCMLFFNPYAHYQNLTSFFFQACRELRNFSSLHAIVSGLKAHPIHRLKRTWQQVSSANAAQLEELSRINIKDVLFKVSFNLFINYIKLAGVNSDNLKGFQFFFLQKTIFQSHCCIVWVFKSLTCSVLFDSLMSMRIRK